MTDGGESGPSPAAGPGGASRGMYAASFASFAACLLYLLWFAGRRVLGDVRRCRCGRSLPAAVCFLLSLSPLQSWSDAAVVLVLTRHLVSMDDGGPRALLLQFIVLCHHSVLGQRTLLRVLNKHSAVKLLSFSMLLFKITAGALVDLVAPTAQERSD